MTRRRMLLGAALSFALVVAAGWDCGVFAAYENVGTLLSFAAAFAFAVALGEQ